MNQKKKNLSPKIDNNKNRFDMLMIEMILELRYKMALLRLELENSILFFTRVEFFCFVL